MCTTLLLACSRISIWMPTLLASQLLDTRLHVIGALRQQYVYLKGSVLFGMPCVLVQWQMHPCHRP